MSLTSYMTGRLDELTQQWGRSLVTLPDSELRAQREALEAQRDRLGPSSPAGLVLTLLEAETARREVGK